MAGKAGASGRKASAAAKKHAVAARLNDADYAVFVEMKKEEASALRPKGIDLTESEFLRLLIFEGAQRRGKDMGVQEKTRTRPAPASKAPPASKVPPPSKAKPRSSAR